MANTITSTRVVTSRALVVYYVTIASDGTEETDTVVYDSSAVASAIGISDPLTCNLLSVYASVSAASTARVKLEFDATTDVLAIDCPPDRIVNKDFRCIGGLKNTAGTGITGDITITTTGLESGDTITLVIEVKPE